MRVVRIFVMAISLSLNGCGVQTDGREVAERFERFEPGVWEVEEYQESLDSGYTTEPTTHTITLRAEEAAAPMPSVFGSVFYRSMRDTSGIEFENGRIRGGYDQPRVDDLEGTFVPVAGTYSPQHFDVSFEFEAAGFTVRQTLRGRIIEPAR